MRVEQNQIKIAIALLFVGAVVIFATVRVVGFVHNPRKKSAANSQSQIIETRTQNYDQNLLHEGLEDFVSALIERVRVSFGMLQVGQQPTAGDAQQIAEAFGEFVRLHRVGTREEFLEYRNRRGLPTQVALQKEDIQSAERTWKSSSAWAKHTDIDTGSIEVIPRVVNGQINQTNVEELKFTRPREIRTGGWLSRGDTGGFSAYELRLPIVVPSVDAKEDLPIEMGFVFIDDGKNGEWSVVEVRTYRVPQGKYVFTPYP